MTVPINLFYTSIDNEIIAFYSMKKNNENVYEIYVCGVLKNYHNKGFGTELYLYIENIMKNESIQYIEVKTLDESLILTQNRKNPEMTVPINNPEMTVPIN